MIVSPPLPASIVSEATQGPGGEEREAVAEAEAVEEGQALERHLHLAGARRPRAGCRRAKAVPVIEPVRVVAVQRCLAVHACVVDRPESMICVPDSSAEAGMYTMVVVPPGRQRSRRSYPAPTPPLTSPLRVAPVLLEQEVVAGRRPARQIREAAEARPLDLARVGARRRPGDVVVGDARSGQLVAGAAAARRRRRCPRTRRSPSQSPAPRSTLTGRSVRRVSRGCPSAATVPPGTSALVEPAVEQAVERPARPERGTRRPRSRRSGSRCRRNR